MKTYADLSTKGQIQRIRRALDGVVEREWGMRDPSLRLVSHQYNTTFRVDAQEGRYALRVNAASVNPMEKVLAEIAFVQHLQRAKWFKVAAPVPKVDGSFVTTLDIPGFSRPVYAVLYEWLPDPTVGRKATPEILKALGRATRELHALGREFGKNSNSFPVLTEPYYGDTYRLEGQDLDLALFEECAKRTMAVFRKLEAVAKIPIHADLHLSNAKYGAGGLSIFDFDDAMVSWPIMDAAISMWYFRFRTKTPEMEQFYWEGFETSPADSGISPAEFETLIAARTLLLVNYILGAENVGASDKKAFVARCEAMLRHYVSTGRFAPWEVA